MAKKYEITIKNSEESSLKITNELGAVQVKDVSTKSVLNSFSLEQKLISFGFISPGVIKHRKKANSYDIAVLIPHHLVGEGKERVIMPQTIAVLRTNPNFDRLEKVELYQVLGLGYRGPATEVVQWPYQYKASDFGTSFSKDVLNILMNKLLGIANRFASEGSIKFSNGNSISMKDYISKHKDSVLLDSSFCHTNKLTLTNIFGQF